MEHGGAGEKRIQGGDAAIATADRVERVGPVRKESKGGFIGNQNGLQDVKSHVSKCEPFKRQPVREHRVKLRPCYPD